MKHLHLHSSVILCLCVHNPLKKKISLSALTRSTKNPRYRELQLAGVSAHCMPRLSCTAQDIHHQPTFGSFAFCLLLLPVPSSYKNCTACVCHSQMSATVNVTAMAIRDTTALAHLWAYHSAHSALKPPPTYPHKCTYNKLL